MSSPNGSTSGSRGFATRLLSVIAVGCIAITASAVDAQINRSRPPSAPAPSGNQGGNRPSSSGGSPTRADSPSTYGGSSDDRGRTPTIGRRDTTSGSDRPARNSLDRYNRTQESAAARRARTSPRVYFDPYYPYYPYGYFPGGYFPGGYIPGGYDPYGYPPDPYYPYPEPRYPAPARDRSGLAARYDSPYYYCDDMAGGQYVSGSTVLIQKPKRLYTPTPVYKDGHLDHWRDLGADDYMADRNADKQNYRVGEQAGADRALQAAVSDIQASWRKGDVEPLSRHVRKDTPIAVVLRGKYLYSLEAGDFLGVTEAALASTNKPTFLVDHLHRRADGIFALTGRHLFTDNRGNERTIFFTYVLQEVEGDYTIIQIAAADDRD